jgi:hypothetical protein
MAMPEDSPFIGKVLAVSGLTVGGINLLPSDNKVTVEGVLSASMVYECEEKNINSHTVQVPFSAGVKVDGCTKEHNFSVSANPLSCNVKARRGKELLVDLRLGMNISANSAASHKIMTDTVIGPEKERDASAITIHIAGERENLWDIAKRVGISTAEIIRQNPGCEQGINHGDRIVLYRQEVINF